MSTSVFPALAGLGWPVDRSEMWSTTVQTAVSGDEVRISRWAYPRHKWELTFDFLRTDPTYQELQQLLAFFDLRRGSGDSFLFADPDDNQVTGQGIGAGDGATTAFQLLRAFGGYTEPVLAPNVVAAVYINAVLQSGASWTVSPWGTTAPGVLTFVAAPVVGAVITADFTYYFPVRFMDDTMVFSKFLATIYDGRKVGLISLKSGS